MKRYDFPTPRLAFGLAAVALTALTLATALVVPASLEPARAAPPLVANAAADDSYRTEVVVTPTRIDVIAVRTSTTAATPARHAPPKPGQPV
jgi:hypothetical protein